MTSLSSLTTSHRELTRPFLIREWGGGGGGGGVFCIPIGMKLLAQPFVVT